MGVESSGVFSGFQKEPECKTHQQKEAAQEGECPSHLTRSHRTAATAVCVGLVPDESSALAPADLGVEKGYEKWTLETVQSC